MKRSEQEKLLNQILAGEDADDFEQASLEHGLSSLRTQRRRGNLLRAGAIAAVFGLLATGVFLKTRPPAAGSSVAQLSETPASKVTGRVEFISDDELLALFPNRPVALIGKPGQQRLVFLDKVKSDPADMPF